MEIKKSIFLTQENQRFSGPENSKLKRVFLASKFSLNVDGGERIWR